MVQPRAGTFRDLGLAPVELPPELRDLEAWVDAHSDGLLRVLGDEGLLAALRVVAGEAQDRLDEDRRLCLVHADLNPKNLLVDPGTLVVTGVLDWELAHAGSPYADLGHLLRFERDPDLTEAVLDAYLAFMPPLPEDVLDRARAADLFALVDLAARPEQDEVSARAGGLLAAIARAGHPGASAA
jgi:aminoglycoside phosphotransferase (APT) family kinase protein